MADVSLPFGQVRLGDEVRIRLACVYGNQEGRKVRKVRRRKNIAQSEEVVSGRTEVPQN